MGLQKFYEMKIMQSLHLNLFHIIDFLRYAYVFYNYLEILEVSTKLCQVFRRFYKVYHLLYKLYLGKSSLVSKLFQVINLIVHLYVYMIRKVFQVLYYFPLNSKIGPIKTTPFYYLYYDLFFMIDSIIDMSSADNLYLAYRLQYFTPLYS